MGNGLADEPRLMPGWNGCGRMGKAGLFTLVEEGLDEYEYFQQGSLVIAVRDGEDYKVQGGVDAEVLAASSSRVI